MQYRYIVYVSTNSDNSTVIDRKLRVVVRFLHHIIFLPHFRPYHYQCDIGLLEF